MTPSEIEQFTRRELYRPFPYADCRALQSSAATDENLIPDLNYYMATIVGYASSATGLRNRNKQQLAQHMTLLRQTFFGAFPRYQHLCPLITAKKTSDLLHHLDAIERIRTELLPLIESCIAA